MTCIVGLISDGKVYMGCESRTTTGKLGIVNRITKKVFQKDNFLMGSCGYSWYSSILKYRFNPPKRNTNTSVIEYFNTSFIDELWACLKNTEFIGKDTLKALGGSQLLVGYEGKLYCIDPDYTVTELVDCYSIGTGSEYAMGSLETTKDMKMEPKERIELALKVACKFDGTCSSPFFIKDVI